jgi:hypothetical protein
MRFFPKATLMAQPVSWKMASVSAQKQESTRIQHPWNQPWEEAQFAQPAFSPKLTQIFPVPQYMPFVTSLRSPLLFQMEQEWLRAVSPFRQWANPVIGYPYFFRALCQFSIGNPGRPKF